MLKIAHLQTGFIHKKTTTPLLDSISFEVAAGELCIILGRNGTGKTTLLRTIAGFHKALGGHVYIEMDGTEVELTQLAPDIRAKQFSIVTTERFRLGYFSVQDVVALGRHPYTGYFGQLDSTDHQVIQEAIEQTGIQSLLHKPLAQLSDGEYQKVMIARALAQDTPLLLLDEPTAHLDLVNRMAVFQLLKKLSTTQGKAILCTTHEVELALQVADKLVLLHEHQSYIGTPAELVDNGQIEAAYAMDGLRFDRKAMRFSY